MAELVVLFAGIAIVVIASTSQIGTRVNAIFTAAIPQDSVGGSDGIQAGPE